MCPLFLFLVMHLISPEVVDFLLNRIIEKKWKELVRKMWILEIWAPHQNTTILLSLNDKGVITSQPWNMKHPPLSLLLNRPHLTKLSPIYWAPEHVSPCALQHTKTTYKSKDKDARCFWQNWAPFIERKSACQHAPLTTPLLTVFCDASSSTLKTAEPSIGWKVILRIIVPSIH